MYIADIHKKSYTVKIHKKSLEKVEANDFTIGLSEI